MAIPISSERLEDPLQPLEEHVGVLGLEDERGAEADGRLAAPAADHALAFQLADDLVTPVKGKGKKRFYSQCKVSSSLSLEGNMAEKRARGAKSDDEAIEDHSIIFMSPRILVKAPSLYFSHFSHLRPTCDVTEWLRRCRWRVHCQEESEKEPRDGTLQKKFEWIVEHGT